MHTVEHTQGHPPERRTDDEAAGDREQECRRHVRDGETVRGDGADGKAVNEECRRVIQQAFAFENRQDAMRRPQRAEHGRRGDRVRRSDHGTERNRRCPWHGRDESVSDDGDSGGRESNREDDQAGDGRPVVLEISERCIVRGIEQDWCNEQRQRQLGRKRERRCGRKKREQRTAKRQEHRIRCADAAGNARQDHGGDEETEKLFKRSHMTAGRPSLL